MIESVGYVLYLWSIRDFNNLTIGRYILWVSLRRRQDNPSSLRIVEDHQLMRSAPP